MLGRIPNGMDKGAPFLVKPLQMVFEQQAAVAFDAAQRGFQVMRDGVRESLELARLGVERGGAVGYALFELGVELIERLFNLLALGDIARGHKDARPPTQLDQIRRREEEPKMAVFRAEFRLQVTN